MLKVRVISAAWVYFCCTLDSIWILSGPIWAHWVQVWANWDQVSVHWARTWSHWPQFGPNYLEGKWVVRPSCKKRIWCVGVGRRSQHVHREHDRDDEPEDGVKESQEMVISTKDMPKEDWIKTRSFATLAEFYYLPWPLPALPYL